MKTSRRKSSVMKRVMRLLCSVAKPACAKVLWVKRALKNAFTKGTSTRSHDEDNGNRARRYQISRIRVVCKTGGRQEFSVIRNTPDGNCLFRAISQAIFRNEFNHPSIRHDVVHYITEEERWKDFFPFIRGQHEHLAAKTSSKGKPSAAKLDSSDSGSVATTPKSSQKNANHGRGQRGSNKTTRHSLKAQSNKAVQNDNDSNGNDDVKTELKNEDVENQNHASKSSINSTNSKEVWYSILPLKYSSRDQAKFPFASNNGSCKRCYSLVQLHQSKSKDNCDIETSLPIYTSPLLKLGTDQQSETESNPETDQIRIATADDECSPEEDVKYETKTKKADTNDTIKDNNTVEKKDGNGNTSDESDCEETVERLRQEYKKYMLTEKAYGTLQELVAAAEYFKFNLVVFREIPTGDFNVQSFSERQHNVTHCFLFTGHQEDGHFELLDHNNASKIPFKALNGGYVQVHHSPKRGTVTIQDATSCGRKSSKTGTAKMKQKTAEQSSRSYGCNLNQKEATIQCDNDNGEIMTNSKETTTDFSENSSPNLVESTYTVTHFTPGPLLSSRNMLH